MKSYKCTNSFYNLFKDFIIIKAQDPEHAVKKFMKHYIDPGYPFDLYRGLQKVYVQDMKTKERFTAKVYVGVSILTIKKGERDGHVHKM